MYRKKIYCVDGSTFIDDISLQYGYDVFVRVERMMTELFEDNDIYIFPLNEKYGSDELLIVATYYRDIAPWAETLVVNWHKTPYFE
jgi:hypothetical protein